MMNAVKTLAISAVCSLASVAAYDQLYVVKSTPLAVANYEMALTALGDPNVAVEALRAKSSILSAEGYVVIDSRVLLGYPEDIEIPREVLNSTQAPKGDVIPPRAVEELGEEK
jgi:hypothetical protein